MRTQRNSIPNQVFIGCPWWKLLPKYEAIIPELNKKFPISFVIIGRREKQDAEDLLNRIKENLLASSYAVFDATGGNANVSLEYGFSEASDIPRALYLCTHKATRKATKDAPIISDLAGKSQNHYKQQDDLSNLLADLCRNHAYTKRFERFMATKFKRASKGEKKSGRALALKIIHALDRRTNVRRDDLVQEILALGYNAEETNDMLKRLHSAGLINCSVGKHSRVAVT